MEAITNSLDAFNGHIYQWILIPLLIGAGLYFTVRSRFLQFRLFGSMIKNVFNSRDAQKHEISSFQAFAIGLASRVGTGNVVGVAIAITLGGPGAVFWMWVVALLGMATAFIEAALAQIFKVRWHDGTFRGGPAFYIWKGLRSWRWGAAFAIALIFTYGVVFEFVQANTIADTLKTSYSIEPWISGLVIALLTAVVVLGGIKSVARVTEYMVPFMALTYIVIALLIIGLNYDKIGFVFTEIFQSAFGLNEAYAGTAGGIIAAMMNGVKRGLYSNEAGMGSAPNAASTATTTHPARQGLIQSMGVFVDTIIVCSATAFIILVGGIYKPGQELEGASLTTNSAVAVLGGWIEPILIFLILIFCFSTLIGNYAYAEVNMDYLFPRSKNANMALRWTVVIASFIGAVSKIAFVWVLADTAMFFMAVINLVAILLLGKWAFGVLKDYEGKAVDARFIAAGNKHMPGEYAESIWTAEK